MSDLGKKKEKKRGGKIRRTLSNKKKRESQYRRTIIERQQNRKSRKTTRKAKNVRSLKKRGGVAPPRSSRGAPPTRRRGLEERMPTTNLLNDGLNRLRNMPSLYIDTAYHAIITNTGNLETINRENINLETIGEVNAFDYITNSIVDRFREIINNGNDVQRTLIHDLLALETDIEGETRLEATLDELRSRNQEVAVKYENFINQLRSLNV